MLVIRGAYIGGGLIFGILRYFSTHQQRKHLTRKPLRNFVFNHSFEMNLQVAFVVEFGVEAFLAVFTCEFVS